MSFRLDKTTEYRKGVTLIEMLVVVAIMMTMLALVTPMFQADGTSRIPQDTARSVSSYLQEARAKAISTGRPCGVAFIPYDAYPTACVVAQIVETPPLYTGEAYTSKVSVTENDNSITLGFFKTIKVNGELTKVDESNENWAQAGNLIRLGSRGVWYEMTSATSAKLQTGEDGPDEKYRPWSNGTWETTYEIQAVPVAQAKGYLQSIGMAEPLKVPRGGAIDLTYSGVGESGQFNNTAKTPIVILFSATGDVYQFIQNNKRSVPNDKIYILCGQWERSLGNKFQLEDGLLNYQHPDNFYVVIDPTSGMTTVEQIVNTSSVGDSRNFN